MKVFSRALGHYGWITLKELYGSHGLTFNYLVETEIVPSRTAQGPFIRSYSLREEEVLPATISHVGVKG